MCLLADCGSFVFLCSGHKARRNADFRKPRSSGFGCCVRNGSGSKDVGLTVAGGKGATCLDAGDWILASSMADTHVVLGELSGPWG